RVHRAVAAARGERIEERMPRSFQRRLVSELRERVVAEPVEHNVDDLVHSRYLTMSAKSSASSDAPPTSAPSMLSSAMKSLMLPGFTLPPYWIRSALVSPFMLPTVLRMRPQT